MAKDIVVKVDKKIKPIHFSNRNTPLLEIGNKYWISFGSNKAKQGTLVEVHPNNGVSVRFNNGVNGLFADELGLTPEQAVINQVTL
jgi:hypothetical protein